MGTKKSLVGFFGKQKVLGSGLLILVFSTSFLQAQTIRSVDTTDAFGLFQKGIALQEDARFERSVTVLKQAAHAYTSAGRWQQAVKCYNNISSNYRLLHKLEKAEQFAALILEIAEEHHLSIHSEIAEAYNNLGIIETERNNIEKAISFFNAGLRKARNTSVPSHIEASLLASLGSVYDDQGQFDKALDYYSKGIDLLYSSPEPNQKKLAKLYNYFGVTNGKKGRYEQALQFYEKELEINKQLYGETHPSVAGGYNNVGGIYYRSGDIGEAIVYFKKAAASTERIFGKMHPRAGLLYNNIGACYYEEGDYPKAIDYLKKSAEIKKQTQGANHPDLALTYNNIGSIYIDMEKYETALEYLCLSLDIRKKSLGENHPDLFNNYNALGLLYKNLNDLPKAITYFKKGLEITRQARGEQHPFVSEALTNLAKVHAQTGDYAKSLSLLQQALTLLSVDSGTAYGSFGKETSFRYPTYAVEVLFEKGKTHRKYFSTAKNIQQLKEGRETYMRLSALLDDIQIGFQNENSKLLMGTKSHQIYEEAIQLSYELYGATNDKSYLQDIYFFTEKSKSRVILELLNNKQARQFAGIPDSLTVYENELRQQLSKVQQELIHSVDDSRDSKQLQDSLFTLRRTLNKHLDYLEHHYPRYHAFKYSSEIPAAPQVSNSLSRKGLTLVEYFYGDETSWAVVLNKNGLNVTRLPHQTDLAGQVSRFNKAITQKQDSTYLKLGHALYQTLLEPIKGQLESTTPLLIVPDGILSLLPFEALLTKSVTRTGTTFNDLPYLLNSYSISYTPSVSLSSFFNTRPPKLYPKRLVAFAPVFSFPTAGGFQREGEGNRWAPLPSTEYEIKQIATSINEQRSFWAALTGKHPAKMLLGREATESRFKHESLKSYQYVHLATHAFTSHTGEGTAGIVFYPDKETKEDGILYAEEIYGLTLQNELVVLSACETGTGTVRAGEGIIGLSRAFQYAGVENLMVSLWNVEDRSTSRLMITFYRLLQQAKEPPYKALRQAKLNLTHTLSYSHPRYWAPFIFIGN